MVFLRQRERLRYRETLRSLNAFRSSPKPSLGNFLRAYWYLWAASFIFPFLRTQRTKHAVRTRTEPTNEKWSEVLYRYSTPQKSSVSHQSHKQHTHTLHMTGLAFLPQNSIKCGSIFKQCGTRTEKTCMEKKKSFLF